MFHNIETCGYEYFVTPNDFLNGHRCPKCSKVYKRSPQDFRDELFHKHGVEFTPLSDFVNTESRITMRHNICGHVWDVFPTNLLKKSHCPKCSAQKAGEKMNLSIEEVKSRIEKVDGYTLLSESYRNAHIKLDMVCSQGHVFKLNYANFSQGQRCAICSQVEVSLSQRKDINVLEEDVINHGFKIIDWIGEYKNQDSRFILECSYGHQNETSVASFCQNHGCKSCHNSTGEDKINLFLIENNIRFKDQFTFDDCKNIHKLPFDFAILNEDNSVKSLVEYDGELHYMAVKYFGGQKTLEYTQFRDEIKTQYCIKNGIRLLRIPYWEKENIESILKVELLAS